MMMAPSALPVAVLLVGLGSLAAVALAHLHWHTGRLTDTGTLAVTA